MSATEITTRWKARRYAMAKAISLEFHSTRNSGLLPIEESCTCQGQGVPGRGACSECRTLGCLYPNGNLQENGTALIRNGPWQGSSIRLERYRGGVDISAPLAGYAVSTGPQELMKRLDTDLTAVTNTHFLECRGSPLEHYAYCSSFLENEMLKIGLPTLPTFRSLSQCGNDLQVVEEVPTLGKGTLQVLMSRLPETGLDWATVKGILLQLISTLHFYSSFYLTHGNPDLHHLGLGSSPVGYLYRGVKIVSPLTLYLIPSGRTVLSSMDRQDNLVRIYHPGTLQQGGELSSPVKERGSRFRPGPDYGTVTLAYGLPLCNSAYDVYSFLAALYQEPAFREVAAERPEWIQLWNRLCSPEMQVDYKQVLSSSLSIPAWLGGHWLEREALDLSWQEVQRW